MKPLRLFLALGLLVGCTKSDPEPPPPKLPAPPAPPVAEKGPDWKNAFKHAISYDAAAKAIRVDVDIAPGYHAYTVGESIGKPLKLSMHEHSAFAHAGEVQYPEGKEKTLPIGRSVIVEGKAKVVAPIAQREGGKGDVATGKFRYQVCTDEACDRPRTSEFKINVN